jgi:hypothetical protein
MPFSPTRRDFLKQSSLSSLALLHPLTAPPSPENEKSVYAISQVPVLANARLDLSPARWVWYPMNRCLQNTVVLFRKEITLSDKPTKATGFLLADSRYQLFVNGQRVQFGPAPSDPRWPEADPMDLTALLKPGRNVIGVQVLYYGQGDGTWPVGRPGLLFNLSVQGNSGQSIAVLSDSSWQSHVARSWRPGQYKRWYLRAFQEEFDARLYPYGWSESSYTPKPADWVPVQVFDAKANLPSLSVGPTEYQTDVYGVIPNTWFTERSVPMVQETLVPAKRLAESLTVQWLRPSADYFEFVSPNSFTINRNSPVLETSGSWKTTLPAGNAVALTFEFEQQSVGFPYFTIDAPAGTTIELMVQEAHKVGGEPLLNTKFHSWTRFICREGINRFETFDYESFRWLQLHIHGADGATVTVRDVGMRRRQYPWPNRPQVECADAKIQKVLEASINTLHNSAQETVVDGMARERQQYSGDAGHQFHALQYTFGDTKLHRRFANTFSQGLTKDGYFLDCWPAYDRLARLVERQLDISQWGPLLDHSVGFNFDCWYYYLYTADLAGLTEVFPRLVRFYQYLISIRDKNGLLPVENLAITAVWIDHSAYEQQRHKQCAFTLYAAAMLENAFAPLCQAFGETALAKQATASGVALRQAAIRQFWDSTRQVFVNNKPWLAEDKKARLCDRSLATAILFDQCPGGPSAAAVSALADVPADMGLSYPANANWRYWALAKAGRVQPILDDLRTRWYDIESVVENNTLGEWWHLEPDTGKQWSHCPVAPLFVLYMNIAGIAPTQPGFRKVQIRPQLGDLSSLQLTAFTPQGPIQFEAEGSLGNRRVTITASAGSGAALVVPKSEKIPLPMIGPLPGGLMRYQLPADRPTTVVLRAV